MKLSKVKYRFGGALRTKSCGGQAVQRGNQHSSHVKNAMKAGGIGEVGGGAAPHRLDRPGRKMGGKAPEAKGEPKGAHHMPMMMIVIGHGAHPSMPEKKAVGGPAMGDGDNDADDMGGPSDGMGKKNGGRLTAKSRNALSTKSFALPGRRYPIEDASHARNALSRVSANGSSEEKAEVRAKVHAKYSGIGKDE